MKNLSVGTLQYLVSFLDKVSSDSKEIANLPVMANVLHSLVAW